MTPPPTSVTTQPPGSLPPAQSGPGNLVRLRTLALLRWVAIGGQLAAIFAAWRFYDSHLPFGACLMVIGAAVLVNLVVTLRYPANARASERGTLFALLFDAVQLAVLLGLTGGIDNPFALFLIVPVTIAATMLKTRATLIVGLVVIGLVSAIALYSLPLRLRGGGIMTISPTFEFGYWLAIVVGVVFLGLFAGRVAAEMRAMGDALLATQIVLAREQKVADLAGIVAATAHELGTPLATIKLASTELARDLKEQPELREDAVLIRDQANRCRDILRAMGGAGKDDLLLRAVPLSTVVREAAEPHADRGKTLHFDLGDDPDSARDQPLVARQPEIVHALRNLIQNAVDFARSGVWIDIDWTEREVSVRIADDGPGYPPHLLGNLGEPFAQRRRDDSGQARPGYEGMGLGLFIARTLLERTGASLHFANGSDPFLSETERPLRSGAVVEVTWPREWIELEKTTRERPENP